MNTDNIHFTSQQDEILAIPSEQRVFVFWQSSKGVAVPGYISLCLETFRRFNPEMHVFFLNYDNIYELLGDVFDWQRFIRMSFMLQSDVLKTFMIFKYGGIFLDADFIYIKGGIGWLSSYNPEQLSGLGGSGYMHLALVCALYPNNFLLWHCAQMQKYKISQIPLKGKIALKWNYMGNSIYNPMVRFAASNNSIRIVPAASFFLERHFGFSEKVGLDSNKELYRRFWFDNVEIPIEKMLSVPKYGIIYLHNNWTARHIKAMSAKEFLQQDFTMAKVFRYLLEIDDIDENELIKIPVSEKEIPNFVI